MHLKDVDGMANSAEKIVDTLIRLLPEEQSDLGTTLFAQTCLSENLKTSR